MTIRDIIEACENVKVSDNVTVVFKVIDEDNKMVHTTHRVKSAYEWKLSDIANDYFGNITFKVICEHLIIKVKCYKF